MPAHIREKIEARKQAAREECIEQTAIFNEPANAGQEELIQRAIGVINPLGVGQILAQIYVRNEIAEVSKRQTIHFNYTPPTKEETQVEEKEENKRRAITVNTDMVGTFGPPTAAQYQSKRTLAFITAGAQHHSEEFELPLFCDMGAGKDICSLNRLGCMGSESGRKTEKIVISMMYQETTSKSLVTQ